VSFAGRLAQGMKMVSKKRKEEHELSITFSNVFRALNPARERRVLLSVLKDGCAALRVGQYATHSQSVKQ
jgi:hypothetical protein